MRERVLHVIGVTAALAVVSMLIATVSAQAPRSQEQGGSAQQTGPAAKTPWGEPDLQGIWSDEYQIPLQRPVKFKDKAFFTAEEVADLDKERTAKPSFGEKRAERGTEKDVAGAYDSTVFLT